MPIFEYTAKDSTGTTISAKSQDVASAASLKADLAKAGYSLIQAKKVTAARRGKGTVPAAEIVTFAYKLSGMYSAGLPITNCLEMLIEQSDNQVLKAALTDIKEQVLNGISLREAFGKHPHIFSEFFLGMIEAGDEGGTLSETLMLAATYLENQRELRQKIKSAFIYPIIVAFMCMVIVAYLVIFVVPIFSKIYGQLHVALPGPTQTLVVLSIIVRKYWWLVLSIVFAAIFFFRKYRDNPALRIKLDAWKLNIPVFGKLNRLVVTSRFIRTFAMMSNAGVPLIDSIAVANRVANNHTLNAITENMRVSIAAGSSIAAPLAQCDIFPTMIVQMAAAGEEAGVVPQMLLKGVELIDKDIDCTVKSLLVKLEPALTVIMGVIIGFILLGLYLPMFDYMSHLK